MLFELDEKRIVRQFLDLTAIDNPSLKERKMADEVERILTSLGVSFSEDDTGAQTGSDAGNIYACVEGDLPGSPLLFSAHLDSVSPAEGKRGIVQENGLITSDGTTVLGADDLAGVTGILEAVRYIKEKKLPHRTFELLFTYGEELYDVGSGVFDFSRVKAKEAYVLDLNGSVGNFVYKAPTIISFEIKVKGRAAHAGFSPESGIHAIQTAAEAIAEISMGHVNEYTTVNIGEICGGNGTNIVPGECVVRGEVRSYDHEAAKAQIDSISESFQAKAEARGAKLEIAVRTGCIAYETLLSHPVVERLAAVCREQGFPFLGQESFGGSDNNIFASKGIAGIVLGCGMNNVHSVNENITVSDLIANVRMVLSLITSEL